jgi:hypothetical protein
MGLGAQWGLSPAGPFCRRGEGHALCDGGPPAEFCRAVDHLSSGEEMNHAVA